MDMEMDMEMEMNEHISFDSSGCTGGSLYPPVKRLRKASTSTITADDDNDNKTSSTRSSISEEFDGPLLSQPFDPLQAVILASTRTTTADDDTDNKTSSTRSSISEEFDGPPLSQPFDPLQAVILASTRTATADDDTDNKTSSTRSSISEEFGGPLLSPSSDPLQTVICTTIDEYIANDYSREECDSLWMSIIRQTYPQPHPNIETFEVDPEWLACYASEALDYFKETTGEVYRYEGPRSMCLCSLPDSEYKVTHINFFARPHDKFSELLFFAAVEHGPVRKVVECCIVPLFKAGDDDVPYIKHPPHVDCSECSKFGDAVLCFDVEEESCCIAWSS